jgi:hypothetical protein
LIAPWESREAVLAAQKRPDGEIVRGDDGRLIFLRPGELPLVLVEGRESSYDD